MSSLVLKLKQTQQLNQRLQQSLRILQMSGLELEREVEDWLLDNPLLERPETDEFADSGLNRAVTMPRAGQQLSGDDAEDIWSNIAEEEDFKHYLHAQVCEHPLSQVEAAYVHVLIDFLDEQGYLTDSLEEIIDHTPLEWMLDEEALQNALDVLQTFDPPGVAAADLNIERLRNNPAPSLSGGERRRVEIARVLAMQPRFILLDEPFAGVDPIAVIDIQKIIEFLKSRGIGVLITDHNVRETLSICDRAYIISDGTVLASGKPDDLVNNEQVRSVYLGENFKF